MKSAYADQIKSLAPRYHAGQIEAFIRCTGGLLGEMSARKLISEVALACACCDAEPELAASIAAQYGLDDG